MSNITVIIPVHEFNEEVKGYLENAIKSVNLQEIEDKPEVFVVCSPNIANEIKNISELKFKFHLNLTGKYDFQSQVNLAVSEINTEYFSVLEFDDEYNTTYFGNVEKYIKNKQEVDIFLTMMVEVDSEGNGLRTTNQAVWSQQFAGDTGKMGYLNIDTLKENYDFKLSGAVIKKSSFDEIGGYKVNINMTFGFELLLRALNNDFSVFVVPKIGYKHLATRIGSMSDIHKKTVVKSEGKFWVDVALREYIFNNDREIDTSKLQKIILE